MKSPGHRASRSTCPLIAAACLVLVLLAGCGHGGGAAPSVSASSRGPVAAQSPPSQPLSNTELGVTAQRLRLELEAAYARGRSGKPFQASPSTVAALRRYFRTVDPADFNGASRVAFVWATWVPREPDGHRSTATRQYVDVTFGADGPKMAVAGNMLPGLNDEFFSLSRPSAGAAWRVEGIYYP